MGYIYILSQYKSPDEVLEASHALLVLKACIIYNFYFVCILPNKMSSKSEFITFH